MHATILRFLIRLPAEKHGMAWQAVLLLFTCVWHGWYVVCILVGLTCWEKGENCPFYSRWS